jgi:hypothetical protein
MSKSTVFTSLQARCTSAEAGYYVRRHYRVVGGVVVPVNKLRLVALASLAALTVALVRSRKTTTK